MRAWGKADERSLKAGDVVGVGLEQRPDGGPVRLRRNGRQHKAVGLYFSVKNGRHLPFESRLELHELWRAEVRTEVVSSWPQPFTLRLVLDGVARRYTPDRRDVFVGGGEEIVEVKDDLRSARDPDYGRKLAAVTHLLAERGLAFRVRERSQIEAEPSFSAIESIQRHRRTLVRAEQLATVQRSLASGPRALGAVASALAPGPHARAVVCALMVRRVVRIEIEAGLSAQSLVSLRPC